MNILDYSFTPESENHWPEVVVFKVWSSNQHLALSRNLLEIHISGPIPDLIRNAAGGAKKSDFTSSPGDSNAHGMNHSGSFGNCWVRALET